MPVGERARRRAQQVLVTRDPSPHHGESDVGRDRALPDGDRELASPGGNGVGSSAEHLAEVVELLVGVAPTVEIDRLVGLGEGLTPAGDDLIVGLLAALRVLCRASLERASFVRSLSATVRTRASRTAVLSGHYLRLAADGHFNADVTRLAHAFVSSAASDDFEMRNALDAAFVVGATSGADMVSGIFRTTMWNQTIPDDVRGRMAGIELLSYSIGPLLGQVRSSTAASLTSLRTSIFTGGVLCIVGVGIAARALPSLWRYDARTDPYAQRQRDAHNDSE